LVPGDLESQTRAKRRQEGIPIPDDIWKATADLAASLGIALE
jgi:LDH2 family malate/lactate/ureidoglycolate dehydrogenase